MTRGADIYGNSARGFLTVDVTFETQNFRPILEVLTKNDDGLELRNPMRVVTIDLNGGSLAGSTSDLQIVVSGNNVEFTAPDPTGLTPPPSGTGDEQFRWLGDDGVLYEPWEAVTETVNLLTAQWGDRADTSSDAETGTPCHHRYEWEIYRKATATTDGIMRYRCKYCGTVEYEVPMAAYYVFNKETQEAIQQAAQGATVTVTTPIFISFHEMVRDALIARPDVTLVVEYRNAGKSYEMTIPAGSGDQLETLFGNSQYAGFLYLGGAFATVEK